VLNWELVDFYTVSEPDDEEYFMYISHNIRLMHWIAGKTDALEQWVQTY